MQNWQQLIPILVIVGFSVLSALARKATEAKAAKKRQDAIRRREQEALRTGRAEQPAASVRFDPPQGDGARSGQSLEDIARRRRDQISASRNPPARQQPNLRSSATPPARPGPGPGPAPRAAPQMSSAPQPAPGAVQERVVYIPGVGRVVVRTPTAPQQAPQAARQVPPQVQRAPQPQGTTRRAASREVTGSGGRGARHAPRGPDSRTDARSGGPLFTRVERTQLPMQAEPEVPHLSHAVALTAPANVAPPAIAQPLRAIRSLNRDDWRRAIIMNEILSPPVSQRPDHLAARLGL